MAKFSSDAVLDAALNVIAACTQINVNTQEPSDYTDATVTSQLASGPLTPADFTIADGDAPGNGRKITVGAQTDLNIDNTGTATHVSLVTVVGTLYQYATTSPAQGLTTGGLVDIAAWDIQIDDPI